MTFTRYPGPLSRLTRKNVRRIFRSAKFEPHTATSCAELRPNGNQGGLVQSGTSEMALLHRK